MFLNIMGEGSEKLPESLEKRLSEIIRVSGALGWDREFKPRIKAKRVVEGTRVIRIFVEKKKPLEMLKPFEIIPAKVEGVETDVVEIGHVEAPEKFKLPFFRRKMMAIGPTKRVRPLRMGVSVGNIKITAGTDGTYYTYKGETREGSNFHVLGESVLKNVEDQVREVLQPGSYHGGTMDDLKGYLVWGHKLEAYGSPSNCRFSNAYVAFGNALAKLAGAKTRFTTTLSYEDNDIDFALATIDVSWEPKVLDYDLNGKKLAGHIFAGSDQVTVFCHISNIMKRSGAEPACGQEPYDAEEGDVLEGWSWRLDGYYGTTRVTSKYANLLVDYGEANIMMVNVGMGTKMALPGTSGTALFLKEG